ncbi:Thermophilic metalloprotease [Neomoorella glycerini]|uniref:Thermophilic metalloprotease n=1 Tax=Neomoorella glycerini TaxID=55779 RepID=A0A6I5ZNV3_9FIRM|nr:aminopeptidase [Moorella glycerini]QGP91553.1 Thermophilic metalloprotease [Moorella glycerini]
MPDLASACRLALAECLAVRAGDTVLVVTDTVLQTIGDAFFQAARELKAEAAIITMLPRDNHGQEPPAMVAAAMRQSQVAVLATSRSLSHTRARREANAAGARIASLPGATADMLERTLAVDYTALTADCEHYAAILTRGREVHLTTPAGTDLTFSIAGRQGHPDSGLYRQPGSFGNLPAGEAYIAPVEGTAAGLLVIDGALAGIGVLEKPLRLKVEAGQAVAVSGGREARLLEDIFTRYGPASRNIAELGIGLNPLARLTGNVLEDEKVRGTVHIALGDNSTFGGQVEAPSHLDGILLMPRLRVDGQQIL